MVRSESGRELQKIGVNEEGENRGGLSPERSYRNIHLCADTHFPQDERVGDDYCGRRRAEGVE